MQPHMGDLYEYYKDKFIKDLLIPVEIRNFSISVENQVERMMPIGRIPIFFNTRTEVGIEVKIVFPGTGIDFKRMVYVGALVPELHDDVFYIIKYNIDQDRENSYVSISYMINFNKLYTEKSEEKLELNED